MPNLPKSIILAAMLSASPALSGNLDDPVLEQDLIIAEAENDIVKVDLLMISLTLAIVFSVLGR